MKKIFVASGYDNKSVISRSIAKIKNTEEFAKTTLVDIIEESQYAEYFGTFKNNIPKFKFLNDSKKQLFMIIEFYNKSQRNKKIKSKSRVKTFIIVMVLVQHKKQTYWRN